MKIYLGTDHAGFSFKETIKSFLLAKGYTVEDCGAITFNADDDYPDFVSVAAKKTASDPTSLGIVFGKSGAGECIVANKIHGIRSFLAVSEKNVTLAREHNNANVMSLGSDLVSEEQAQLFVQLFLTTPFSNEARHVRRIEKIKKLEAE